MKKLFLALLCLSQILVGSIALAEPLPGAEFHRRLSETVRALRNHNTGKIYFERVIQFLQQVLENNTFKNLEFSRSEAERLLANLKVNPNRVEFTNRDVREMLETANQLPNLIEDAEKSQWKRLVKTLTPQMIMDLQFLSSRLYDHLERDSQEPVLFSEKRENDPSYSTEDAYQNALAAALNATEAEISQRRQLEHLSQPQNETLETRWSIRQRIAFDVVINQLATGKIHGEQVWNAKLNLGLPVEDMSVPGPALQAMMDEWLGQEPLKFPAAVRRHEEKLRQEELQRQKLAEEARRKEAEAKLAELRKIQAEVGPVLGKSASEIQDQSEEQLTELLRAQLAQSRKVDLKATPLSREAERIKSMSRKELIRLIKMSR